MQFAAYGQFVLVILCYISCYILNKTLSDVKNPCKIEQDRGVETKTEFGFDPLEQSDPDPSI